MTTTDAIATPAELRARLQLAVQLELAALSTALYALYTVGDDPDSFDRFTELAFAGMYHLGLASNVLTAVGGTPRIADATVVPTYPGPLPAGITDDRVVHLLPSSPEAVEQARALIRFQARLYGSLRAPLTTLSLPWDPAPDRQLVEGERLHPVLGVADALRAIDAIVDDGAGWSPPAPAPSAVVLGDPTTHDLSGLPDVRAGLDTCDRAYTVVLTGLHDAVRGDETGFNLAFDGMRGIKNGARDLVALTFGTPPRAIGPAFRLRPELLLAPTP